MTKQYTPAQLDSILARCHKAKVLDTYNPDPVYPYIIAALSLFVGVVVMVVG